MKLNALEKRENLFDGLKTLFASLNVPVNHIDEKAITPKEILSKTYKENNEAYQLMDDVFVVGMVDNAAFEGEKSETIAAISTPALPDEYQAPDSFVVSKKECNPIMV